MVWGVLVWFGVFWGDSMDPEAKGPVSLCANIANMCVPFQIVCNGYTKIRHDRKLCSVLWISQAMNLESSRTMKDI